MSNCHWTRAWPSYFESLVKKRSKAKKEKRGRKRERGLSPRRWSFLWNVFEVARYPSVTDVSDKVEIDFTSAKNPRVVRQWIGRITWNWNSQILQCRLEEFARLCRDDIARFICSKLKASFKWKAKRTDYQVWWLTDHLFNLSWIFVYVSICSIFLPHFKHSKQYSVQRRDMFIIRCLVFSHFRTLCCLRLATQLTTNSIANKPQNFIKEKKYQWLTDVISTSFLIKSYSFDFTNSSLKKLKCWMHYKYVVIFLCLLLELLITKKVYYVLNDSSYIYTWLIIHINQFDWPFTLRTNWCFTSSFYNSSVWHMSVSPFWKPIIVSS